MVRRIENCAEGRAWDANPAVVADQQEINALYEPFIRVFRAYHRKWVEAGMDEGLAISLLAPDLTATRHDVWIEMLLR